MTTPEPITMAREIIHSTAIINVYWVLSRCLELKVCGNTSANRRQISTLNRSYILEEHTDNWHVNKCILIIYLVLIFISAVLGLHCCVGAFAGYSNWRLLFFVVHGLLIALASLVTEHGLWIHRLQQSQHEGSVVVLHGLSCSAACGMFPNEGSNTCPLHW